MATYDEQRSVEESAPSNRRSGKYEANKTCQYSHFYCRAALLISTMVYSFGREPVSTREMRFDGMYLPFNTVAQTSFFATTKARTDRRLDALVPAPIGESVNRRLNAGLSLLCVEERLELCHPRITMSRKQECKVVSTALFPMSDLRFNRMSVWGA